VTIVRPRTEGAVFRTLQVAVCLLACCGADSSAQSPPVSFIYTDLIGTGTSGWAGAINAIGQVAGYHCLNESSCAAAIFSAEQ
jgi:hypothetical protein